jgi:hypothetical protein
MAAHAQTGAPAALIHVNPRQEYVKRGFTSS